jgi:hypothetical protein
VIEKLDELGFSATELSTKAGKTLFRIWTDQGWTYERFATVDDVVAWAKGRKP